MNVHPSICIGVVLGAGASGLAGAAAGDADQQSAYTLEEITITAQRRTENAQDVPIAVTALQGDQLEGKAVFQLSDLQYASPSLSIGDGSLVNFVNIRGIGLGSSQPSVQNGVATYYDGLFQPPIVTTNRFYDIADVEVLRGPQGTLVGSNSTGGAIFINSQNPKLAESDGYVRLGGGNYHGASAQGAINIPVNDVLALRLAGEYEGHSSFYHSVGPAYTDAAELNEKSGRIGILVKPGALQVLGKVEYTDRETGGYPYVVVPGGQGFATAPKNPFDLSYDTPELNHESSLLSLTEMRYEFNSGITLRSLSGYQDKKVHNLIDFDATSTINPPQSFDQRIRQRTWSEEINLLSSTAGRYDWVLGGYWQKDKINVDISAAGSTGPGGPDLYIFNPQSKTTTGWFGQLNFKLTAKWELQAGVRYSTFKTDGTGYVSLVLPAPVCAAIGLPSVVHGCQLAATDGSESDGRVTGKVALNYTPNEQNLLYAFVARGYKQGGFNSPTSLFSPETVMDYELGWKSELVGRHLATQLGGFYYDYHGFQFQTLNLNNGQTGVENLPKATIYGIEASLQAQIGGLRADLGAAYVHSNQPSPGPFVNQHLLPPGVQGPQCAPGQTANCFDYSPYLNTGSSGPNLYSPEWTANAGVQYAFTVANATTLTPRINYAYVSGQFTSLTYSKQTDYLPPHGLLSALVTLDVGEHWGAEVFGSNFTDKRYRSGSSGAFYLYGAPRQYGVHVRYRF